MKTITMDKQRFIDIAKRVGGIVVEDEGTYKHFKSVEELINWAKRLNIYKWVPYLDPKDGKMKLIQYFDGVNFVCNFP